MRGEGFVGSRGEGLRERRVTFWLMAGEICEGVSASEIGVVGREWSFWFLAERGDGEGEGEGGLGMREGEGL